MNKVLDVGIDWNKTKPPDIRHDLPVFTTTYDPNDYTSATIGTLVLNDGSSEDDAVHLAQIARDMMKGKTTEVEKLASKL